MRLDLSETQKTGFLASWARISTGLGQILQGQQIIIFKTKKNEEANHQIWASSRENLLSGSPTK